MSVDDKGNPQPGRGGGGESGGGGYKQVDVQDGDNRERTRPVQTGRKPDPETAE